MISHSFLLRAAVLTAGLVWAGNPPGVAAHLKPQQTQGPQAPQKFRSAVDLVVLNVTVTDDQHRAIKGLGIGDFVVMEDGVKQSIDYFALERVPIDLAILIDTSSSMNNTLSTAQRAATTLAKSLKPGDRVAVIGFSETVDVLHALDTRVEDALPAIRRMKASGGTALHTALYVATSMLGDEHRQQGENRRQVIAALTDGRDTTSLVPREDLMARAMESGVAVYPILLLPPTDYFGNDEGDVRFTMRALAEATGARAFIASQATELQGMYETVANELSQQYTLGYYSTNTARNGGFRKVNVQVVGRGNTFARTRAGYLAPRR